VIDDDGVIVAESAAIALYLADKAHALTPDDAAGRTHVMQWCFAAVAPVAPLLISLDLVEIFDGSNAHLKTEIKQLSGRWLGGLERRLDGRDWIACDEFTVADIMMSGVLRNIRKTELMDPFPRVKAYH